MFHINLPGGSFPPLRLEQPSKWPNSMAYKGGLLQVGVVVYINGLEDGIVWNSLVRQRNVHRSNAPKYLHLGKSRWHSYLALVYIIPCINLPLGTVPCIFTMG